MSTIKSYRYLLIQVEIILAFLFAFQQVDLKPNPVKKESFAFVILKSQESVSINNIKVQLACYLEQIKYRKVVNDVTKL